MAVFLLYLSLHESRIDGGFGATTTRFFTGMVRSPRALSNAINTVVYALGAAVIAVVFGAMQAWLAERTDAPGRSLLYLAAIVSLGIPYVLYTIGWVLLLGRGGPVNAVLQWALGSPGPVVNVYSMTGQIVVEGLLWVPVSFLLLAAVFRNADASLEEASLMSGASVGTTLREITLKLATPAVLALALLVFIRAVESFEVPALVGVPGRVYVLVTEIYLQIYSMTPANYGQAAAFAVVLVLCVSLLLWGYSILSRQAYKYQTVTGKGFRARVVGLGRGRYVATALIVLNIALVIGLPVAMLAWADFLPFYQSFSLQALGLLTTAHFGVVLGSESFRQALGNTVFLGIGAACLVTLASAIGGWSIARRHRGAWMLDQLASAPLAFPAIVLGLAFLYLFLNTPTSLYGTVSSLVIASAVASLPYGIRYGAIGVSQIHGELEEASRLSGAGEATTFCRVILPLIMPSLISCWLLVFLLAVRAVSMPLILAGPDNAVVSTVLFNLWRDGQTGELAAMGLLWTAIMTVLSTTFFVVARRFGTPLQ